MIYPVFGNSILLLIKFFLWALLTLFTVFSLIVLRQVQLMTEVLDVPISGSLKFIAFGLLLFAGTILLVSLAML